MNLEIPSFQSIPLSKISSVVDIQHEIENYELVKENLEGQFKVFGSYYTDNLEEPVSFEEFIDFSIFFDKPNYEINDVTCSHFDYEVIVGRSVEVIFTLEVKYEEVDEFKQEIQNEVDDILKEALSDRDDSFLDEIEDAENNIQDEDVQDEETEMETIKETEDRNETEMETVKETEDRDETEMETVKETEDREEGIELKAVEEKPEAVKEKCRVRVDSYEKEIDIINIFDDSYQTFKVCFVKDEKDIEKIADKYDKSVSEIYEENDYDVGDRVIFKEDE